MKRNENESVTIIGSGIIGICCALKLQSQGYQVTLIDKQAPAAGCSGGNAGHFATEQIFPMASLALLKQLPSILLNPNGPLSIKPSYFPKALPWMLRFLLAARKNQFDKGTKALSALNQAAMSSYKPLLKMAKAENLIEQKGYLLAFEGTQALKLAQEEMSQLKPYNIKQCLIDENEIKQLEPKLKNCKTAVYYPDIYHTINPLKLAQSLFDSFYDQGGQFYKTEVLAVKPSSDGSINLSTATHTIKANKVIIAAGAYSKKLVKELGHKIPLDTERGYHLMLNHKNLLNRPVAFAQRKFIITPMDKGTRLAGTVEFAGLKSAANWKRADMLLNHAQYFLTSLSQTNPENSERWMGFRPSFPDSLPVIDQDKKLPNLFYAFGHQHLGLTQAAVTADLIDDLVNAKKPSIDLKPFSIQRF
jgi:D-amino-acid dehydrogenase